MASQRSCVTVPELADAAAVVGFKGGGNPTAAVAQGGKPMHALQMYGSNLWSLARIKGVKNLIWLRLWHALVHAHTVEWTG